MKNIFKVLSVILLLAGCTSPKPVGKAPRDVLVPGKGQVWQLVALQGKPLDPADKAPTLILNPDAATASGFAYCNNYSFQMKMEQPESHPEGDSFRVQLQLWGTGSLSCPDKEMNAESRYLTLLAKGERLVINATTLVIYQRNKEILRYSLQ